MKFDRRFVDDYISKIVEPNFAYINRIINRYSSRNVVTQFNGKSDLSIDERNSLSYYIALQYLRTPTYKRLLLESICSDNEDVIESLADVLHIRQLFHRDSIIKLSEIISHGVWVIGIDNKESIVISDNPVAMIWGTDNIDITNFSLLNMVTFPLCSSIVLLIFSPKRKELLPYNNMYIQLNASSTKCINLQRALLCDRYIFGKDEKNLMKIADECGGGHRVLSPEERNNYLFSECANIRIS